LSKNLPIYRLVISGISSNGPYCIAFAWPIMAKHDVVHETGSTYRIALSSEKNRATATINIYRKFSEVRTCRFWICERTDIQTVSLQILRTL